MKKIFCVLFALFLSFNAFCIIFDGANSLIKIIDKKLSKEEKVVKLIRRIDELSAKNPDKLRTQLLEKNKNTGKTPLFYAAKIMDENLFDKMVQGLGNDIFTIINQKDIKGRTILLDCIYGYYDNKQFKLSIIKKLIDYGADCNIYTDIDMHANLSVLIAAEWTKNTELIELIISKVNDISLVWTQTPPENSEYEYMKMNPLGLLVVIAKDSNEYNNCIHMLLNKGANPNTLLTINGYSCTPINYAAQFDNEELYNLLIKSKADPAKTDSDGYSANDYRSALYKLIKAYDNNETPDNYIDEIIKTDINKTLTVDKLSAIQIALQNDDSQNAIKLLTAGADVYYKNTQNKSALDYGFERNSKDFIEAFIATNKPAKDSIFSVIDYSLRNNNLAYVKHFLQLDTKKYVYQDKNTGSNHKLFTYIASSKEGTSEQKKELLDYLLNNGYSVKDTVEAGEDNGNTALFYAAKNNDTKLFDYLIEKGSDLFAYNYNNATILMYISGYSSKELLKDYLVKILSSDKKALTRKDSQGVTPFLYAASYNSDPDVMKILRMYGADVCARDKNNNNAYTLAVKYNPQKEKVIERLESYGVYNE